MKTEQIANIAKEFAKANKISIAKAQGFADQITALTKPVGVGRKADPRTVELRAKVQAAVEAKSLPDTFTAKDVAKTFGCTPVEANNVLRFHQGLFKQAGKKDRAAGEKGRAEVLWGLK